MEMQVNRFFVEIDALMDTRLATLYRLHYPLGLAAAKDPQYGTRKKDYFKVVKGYSELWKSRDIMTLVNSTATPLPKLMSELLKSELDQSGTGFADHELAIYLNVYPYRLTTEEQETFKTVMFAYFPNVTDVTIVSLSPEQLTPSFLITNKIDCYFCYEWQDWLEIHSEWLIANPQPLLHLIGPKLMKYDIKFTPGEDTSIAAKIMEDEGIWQATELGTQSMIALRLMPVNFFNSILTKA